MIGFLQGKVISSDGAKLVLLTQSGVGYEVNYGYFAEVEQSIGIYIHHHISDNSQSLWGFNSLEDKKMFELLKTVNKVGSSKAYPLIAELGTKAVIDAIILDQQNILSSVKGVGKKMAEQLVLSLRDKVKAFGVIGEETQPSLTGSIEKTETVGKKNKISPVLLNETIQALESLGYKDKDVVSVINQVYHQELTTSEALLKEVLKEL